MSIDLDAAIASFIAGAKEASAVDGLVLGHWQPTDWKALLGFATLQTIRSGRELIEYGSTERSLYFVLRGTLEVIVRQADGTSNGSINKEGAGTVLGEVSFLDAQPRSASVWTVDECTIAVMSPEQFNAFEVQHPQLARDLLFALARILAARLRRAGNRGAQSVRVLRAHDPFLP